MSSMNGLIIQLAYVASAALFIMGLKLLGSAATARKGNTLSAVGMLVAIVAALIDQGIVSYQWIIIGIVVGGLIGSLAAQGIALLAVGVFTVVVTWILAKLCALITPLRVSTEDEVEGLDYAAHGERAYDLNS